MIAFLSEQLTDNDIYGSPDDDDSGKDDIDIFNSFCDTGIAHIHMLEINDNEKNEPDENLENDIVVIFAVGTTPPSYEGTHFTGCCIDSGAERTVIGIPQATAYCSIAGIDFKTYRSSHFNSNSELRFTAVSV